MPKLLRLGTRKSLLAWAQSSIVAEMLERAVPGLNVELCGIVTSGDRQTDRPLHQLDGKDFFVKELDLALLAGEVDLCVHSYKDLSLERPEGIVLAATPRREEPHDIILWHPRALGKRERGETLRIGTSSPRRLENIPVFLAEIWPQTKLEWLQIRGNVNSRIQKLEGSEALDGVVLALAGLNRLYGHASSREEITRLMAPLLLQVLPLDWNPTAPAQGALAIECRADDVDTRKILELINDPATRQHIDSERLLMKEWGGGCHQRFGITARSFADETVLFTRGIDAGGQRVDHRGPTLTRNGPIFDGSQWKAKTHSLEIPEHIAARCVFVASARAAEGLDPRLFEGKRVWVSGVASWKKLAAQGIWVEGCSESLGFSALSGLLQARALKLPEPQEFAILTHEGAEWPNAEVHATYRVEYPKEPPANLLSASHIYWSSLTQYRAWSRFVAVGAQHACGGGKTYRSIREERSVQAFVSAKEWRRALGDE